MPDPSPTPDPADKKCYNCNKTKINSKIKGNSKIQYADPLSYNDLLAKETELLNLIQQGIDEGKMHPDILNDQFINPNLPFCERYQQAKNEIKTAQQVLSNPETPYKIDFDLDPLAP